MKYYFWIFSTLFCFIGWAMAAFVGYAKGWHWGALMSLLPPLALVVWKLVNKQETPNISKIHIDDHVMRERPGNEEGEKSRE